MTWNGFVSVKNMKVPNKTLNVLMNIWVFLFLLIQFINVNLPGNSQLLKMNQPFFLNGLYKILLLSE